MSNRANASRYGGAPDVRSYSGGGGADLFGMQFNRQKEIMRLQQQIEQENADKEEQRQIAEEGRKTEQTKTLNSFSAAIDILKQKGIIPNDANIKSYDDATTQQKLAIAQTENAIEAAQKNAILSTVQSKPGQEAVQKNYTDILAKPGFDNREAAARAQANSVVKAAPDETGLFYPAGNFDKPPVTFNGADKTQNIVMTGGIKDPKSGQMLGQKPEIMTSFVPGRFNVGKIALNGGTTPTPENPSADVLPKPPVGFNTNTNFINGLLQGGQTPFNIAPVNNANTNIATKPQGASIQDLQNGIAANINPGAGFVAGQTLQNLPQSAYQNLGIQNLIEQYKRLIGNPTGQFIQGLGQGLTAQ